MGAEWNLALIRQIDMRLSGKRRGKGGYWCVVLWNTEHLCVKLGGIQNICA